VASSLVCLHKPPLPLLQQYPDHVMLADASVPCPAPCPCCSCVLHFSRCAVGAPLWFLLVGRIRPVSYIRFAVTSTAACYCLVLVALFNPAVIDAAIIPVGLLSLAGAMLLSLGYLGEEGVEVSEVGVGCTAASGNASADWHGSAHATFPVAAAPGRAWRCAAQQGAVEHRLAPTSRPAGGRTCPCCLAGCRSAAGC
jgi:hypothetical protein